MEKSKNIIRKVIYENTTLKFKHAEKIAEKIIKALKQENIDT
jgi:hypothetical protein